MSDLFFTAKMMAITVVLVLVMQIKIGDHTLEEKSLAWIHQSSAVENLRTVASGATQAISQGYNAAAKLIEEKWNIPMPKLGSTESRQK